MIRNIQDLFELTIPTVGGIRANHNWRTIVVDSDDPSVLSYKAPISIPRDKKGFEHLLMLCWSYDEPGSRRLPTDSEVRAIRFCTTHLRKTLDQHPNLIYLLSMSSDGLHQWVVATNDLSTGFVAAIDAFPNHRNFVADLGLNPLVIQVERVTDPSWLPIRQARDIAKRFPSVEDTSVVELDAD